jgi:adenylate cyclase
MNSRIEDVGEWLLRAAVGPRTLLALTHSLTQRLKEAGFPLSRLNLGVFAVHPEMAGYAVYWEEGMTEAVETPIRHEDTLQPVYLASPIYWMVENRAPTRFDLENTDTDRQFSVLEEFHRDGHTDYRGFPIDYGENGIAILTVCTRRAGGFESYEIAGLTQLFPIIRLVIEIVETRRLASTVLRTYLGRNTGQMVLEGKIRRGQGETIEAVLWLCDLRDFTSMTEALGAMAMIDIVNLYFDCMANAVWDNGGEILKFMGDAMLVVFRITDEVSVTEAASRAARAAQSAQVHLAELSRQRMAEGLNPLNAGIAVHLGKVVYGNIGAKTRLDFTVMGASVNLVARLQQLTGELGEQILFSSSVPEHLDKPVELIGQYSFKGVAMPLDVYRPTPREE